MKRKISYFLATMLVLSMFSIPVMAAEQEAENEIESTTDSTSDIIDGTVEVDKDSSDGEVVLTPVESEELGSISIKLEDTTKNLSKNGVKLAVVQVADVIDGEFKLLDEYSESGVDLNSIANANELEIAANKLQKIAKSGNMVTTDSNGSASVSELPVGVYLIYAVDIAGYENITPSLVSIPTYSESIKGMSYDIEVFPKHTPLPEVSTPNSKLQTGFDDKALEYALISIGLLVVAGVVITVAYRHGKKEVK